ncbi:hypothetical protein AMTR_s00028p00221130 [Amborella trichopoda]|uniref:Uncharacterized protein n=1 Tax=Amborella trichopoda TaxID=13333 RepID=W1PS69_AMBTC|nr:hypothetical protein AMTR_s00028p00221130 [Amborella trichopoda]
MQHTIASLKPNPKVGRLGEVIAERGKTSRTEPPIQTARFSSKASDEGRTPLSSSTLNHVSKEAEVEPLGLITKISSIPPTISALDADARRNRVEDERASSLEHLPKESVIEGPPLFGPTLSSKTMTANSEPLHKLGLFNLNATAEDPM